MNTKRVPPSIPLLNTTPLQPGTRLIAATAAAGRSSVSLCNEMPFDHLPKQMVSSESVATKDHMKFSLARKSSIISYKKFVREKKSEFDALSPTSSLEDDTTTSFDRPCRSRDSSLGETYMEEENNDYNRRFAAAAAVEYNNRNMTFDIGDAAFANGQRNNPHDTVFTDSVVDVENRKLTREIGDLKEENVELAEQLAQMQRALKTVEQQRMLAEDQIGRVLTQYQALAARLQHMEEDLKGRSEEQKQIEQELVQAQQAADAKDDALKKAQEELEHLQSVCQSLEEEHDESVGAVELRLISVEESMQDLNEQYDNAVHRFNELCDVVDTTTKVAEELRAALRASETRIVQLQNVLALRDAELGDLHEQWNEAGRTREALTNVSFYRPASGIATTASANKIFRHRFETPLSGITAAVQASNIIPTREADFLDLNLLPLPRLCFDESIVADDTNRTIVSDVARENNSSIEVPISMIIMNNIKPLPFIADVKKKKSLFDELNESSESGSTIITDSSLLHQRQRDSMTLASGKTDSGAELNVTSSDNKFATVSHYGSAVPSAKSSTTATNKLLRVGGYVAAIGACVAYHYIMLLLSTGTIFSDSVYMSYQGDEPPAW